MEFKLSQFFYTNNYNQTIAYFSNIFSKFNNINLVLQGNDQRWEQYALFCPKLAYKGIF